MRKLIYIAGLTAILAVTFLFVQRATPKPLPAPQGAASTPGTFYLHGTGSNDNPATLFLNNTVPTVASPKYKESAGVNFANGNPWQQIGTWTAAATSTPQTFSSIGTMQAWLGLKNSDDQGTQFDLRAEVYKNATLISSGQALCITGITRNPDQAKSVSLNLSSISSQTVASGDILALKILARIGTNPNGSKCSGPGGSHSNAIGLRLYFDGVSQPASQMMHLAVWRGVQLDSSRMTVAVPPDWLVQTATTKISASSPALQNFNVSQDAEAPPEDLLVRVFSKLASETIIQFASEFDDGSLNTYLFKSTATIDGHGAVIYNDYDASSKFLHQPPLVAIVDNPAHNQAIVVTLQQVTSGNLEDLFLQFLSTMKFN